MRCGKRVKSQVSLDRWDSGAEGSASLIYCKWIFLKKKWKGKYISRRSGAGLLVVAVDDTETTRRCIKCASTKLRSSCHLSIIRKTETSSLLRFTVHRCRLHLAHFIEDFILHATYISVRKLSIHLLSHMFSYVQPICRGKCA